MLTATPLRQRGAATPWLVITMVVLLVVILTIGVFLTSPQWPSP